MKKKARLNRNFLTQGVRYSALALAVMLPMHSLYAKDLDNSAGFNIQAQSLENALIEFSEQAGIQVIFSTDLLKGANSNGLAGEFTSRAALDQLLSEHQLTYQVVNEDTVAISKLSDANDANSAPSENNRRKDALERDVEEMVVTGSRISRSGFEQPSPTTIISEEAIEGTGLNALGDVLLRTPSVGEGLGSANANFSDDAGATFLNLRGLGIDRTLTLVNGRRRVAGSNTSSAVDLSAIPSAMVERVEIITGGASAVYGADAVTGVVNIITKKDFEGLEVSGRGGVSQHGGGDTQSFNLFGGTQFADERGSLTFGASYNKEKAIHAKQRDFAAQSKFLFLNELNTGPSDGIPDQIHYNGLLLPNTHPAGTFVIGGTRYTVDPGLRPTQNDQSFFGGLLGIGGDGFDNSLFQNLRTPLETFSVMTNLDYELTENVNFFMETSFSNNKATDNRQPSFDNGFIIQRDNVFISDELGALMDANSLSQLSVQRTHYDHGFEINNIDRKTYNFVGGLEGTFNDDWEWQAFYQYGSYNYNSQLENVRINENFNFAADAIADPITGEPICRDAAARADGCVPFNMLGRDGASQEALDYILHTRIRDFKTTQRVAGIQLTGDVFELPAGPLRFATGGEYRKETLSLRDDGRALAGELFFSAPGAQPVDAEFDVSEAYLELLAPVVADKPFMREVNIEGAVRFSDYSSIGNTTATKVGMDWSPIEDIRFRATRSRSVRAPNLNELFSPGVGGFLGLNDPCHITNINNNPTREANCRAIGIPVGWEDPTIGSAEPLITSGNPNLDPETSVSWTFGAVITPRFVENLTVSLDFWSIEIEGAINTIDAQTALDKCFDSASLDNPFCPMFNRDPATLGFTLTELSDINVGKLTAKGIDFQGRYDLDLAIGTLGFLLQGTYLLEHEELVDANDPTSLIVYDGQVTHPKLRMNLLTSYQRDAWTANLSTRVIGPAKGDIQATAESRDFNDADAKIYNDLTVSYAFPSDMSLTIGINNLFDVEPPPLSETYFGGSFQGTAGGGLYDNIGRFFFVGGSVRF